MVGSQHAGIEIYLEDFESWVVQCDTIVTCSQCSEIIKKFYLEVLHWFIASTANFNDFWKISSNTESVKKNFKNMLTLAFEVIMAPFLWYYFSIFRSVCADATAVLPFFPHFCVIGQGSLIIWQKDKKVFCSRVIWSQMPLMRRVSRQIFS